MENYTAVRDYLIDIGVIQWNPMNLSLLLEKDPACVSNCHG